MKTNVERKPRARKRGGSKGVVALAGGWVPVSVAEVLDYCERRANYHRQLSLDIAHSSWEQSRESSGKSAAYEDVAKVIRRQMEAAIVRQPAPNARGEPRARREKL